MMWQTGWASLGENHMTLAEAEQEIWSGLNGDANPCKLLLKALRIVAAYKGGDMAFYDQCREYIAANRAKFARRPKHPISRADFKKNPIVYATKYMFKGDEPGLWMCPQCRGGYATYDKDSNTWHCPDCGASGSTVETYSGYFNVPEDVAIYMLAQETGAEVEGCDATAVIRGLLKDNFENINYPKLPPKHMQREYDARYPGLIDWSKTGHERWAKWFEAEAEKERQKADAQRGGDGT